MNEADALKHDMKRAGKRVFNGAFIGYFVLVPMMITLYRVGEALGRALTP